MVIFQRYCKGLYAKWQQQQQQCTPEPRTESVYILYNVMRFLLFLFLLVTLQQQCLSFSYLILHPFYGGSHVLTLHALAEELISSGRHRVTTVRFADSHNLELRPLGPNHTDILLFLNNRDGSIPYTTLGEKGRYTVPSAMLWTEGLKFGWLLRVSLQTGKSPFAVIGPYCHQLLGNKELLLKLKADKHDVSVVDLIYNECGLALAAHLGTPAVAYWAFSFSGGEAEFSSAATPPSHIPTFMSHLTQDMSFWERARNLRNKLYVRAVMLYTAWFSDCIIWQYFPDLPSSRQLVADLSGALINTNNILDYPRLQPETFLNVGGMQIPKKAQLLPEHIREWVDGAEHGIIVFTMGFIFDPNSVPRERVESLLTAFSRLPHRIIAKLDLSSASDIKLPANVLALPFVPQNSLLSHPKTKVFFTHCGMHGVMEAVYHAVPMVGMPVFIDQGDVAVRMREKGIGIIVDKSASSEDIYRAIVAVSREGNRYKENIVALSELMRVSRRNHPMDEAVWLLEFVAKTGGAQHLKLASRKLGTLEYFCLDVVAFSLLAVWVVHKVFSTVLCYCCCRLNNNEKKIKRD